MLTLNSKIDSSLGPYNGFYVAPNSSLNIVGAVAPYISDGRLLSDIIAGHLSVSFSGNESLGATAAALLMQLGQLLNTDSDGASLSRTKQAPSGWTFQLRSFEFQTSNLGAIFNKDATNNALTDISAKFYDADNNILTEQSDIDSLCVKTAIDLEPAYDYYLIGGETRILQNPNSDVRLCVIAVPDYPAPIGSKVMIQNINMRYLGTNNKVSADGRASKGLLYNNPVPHTNKLRFVVYHDAGLKINFCVTLEIYKV